LGCQPAVNDRPTSTVNSATPNRDSNTTQSHVSADAKPDNTANNQRDRDSNAKTPIKQDENQNDINVTANIRKQILATENMSVNARNAKIITSGGKVTLRGPVESTDEKAKLERIATDVAGEGNVINELEVNK